jgi:NAD/NADP transhydrogenase alpha subunit
MIVGSILENKSLEKRVAITPEIIKKYNLLGLKVNLSKDYATHLGISDEEYEIEGANILSDDKKVISHSDAIVQMSIPNEENLNQFKKDQILIGVLNPYSNEKKLKEIAAKNVNIFSLELLPRITRAQSMDILSSPSKSSRI